MRKETIKAALIIAVFYFVIELLGITCPIYFVTGISCAGCGMSRAWLSLLGGDLAGAFSYHPLFFLPPLALGLWFLRKKLPGRLVKGLGIGILVLFLAVYVVRMADPGDTVVTFSPQEGILPRLIGEILYVLRKGAIS